MLLDRLEDTTLNNIESKILELEENGITTYDFVAGFGDLVSLEIDGDLRVFIDIGWIEWIDGEYKLTHKGKNEVKGFELPAIAKKAFEKLFETNNGKFTVKKVCGICEHHPNNNDNDTCQKGHGIVPYDFDFYQRFGEHCGEWELKKCLIPDDKGD